MAEGPVYCDNGYVHAYGSQKMNLIVKLFSSETIVLEMSVEKAKEHVEQMQREIRRMEELTDYFAPSILSTNKPNGDNDASDRRQNERDS